MFSSTDLKLLKQWQETAADPVTLTVRTTPAPQSAELLSFAEALAGRLPQLSVKRRAADIDTDPPALVLNGRLDYLASPLGPELPPFLAALLDPERSLPKLAPELRERLSAMPLLARLEIFIAPHCPFCPTAVSSLLPVAFNDGPQRLSIIDGALFHDIAEARDIRTAPTVVLDGEFRWTGTIRADEIVDVMCHREPTRLGPDTLRGIIEDGMASTVAQMMADHGAIFDSLLPLLAHEKWPIRLGAMVVMEHFQALRPDLGAAAAERIWPLFNDAADTVKGDLLHVIGETGDRRLTKHLEALTGRNTPSEIAEAAADALECIHRRQPTTHGG